MKQNAMRLKTLLLLLLSFLIPALLTFLIYATHGFTPFGDKSILVMDMAEQNVAFFASLRDMISGESDLFFTWAKSFGSNYIGAFAFYVSSPFSFLTLLFPENQLLLALLLLTVLKIGLSGFTMAIYLRYGCGHNSYAILPLSICYAMMSYGLVYSLSIMWLDGLIWLPLILFGIERILKGKSPILFSLSLAVMFISNYYISYMIGLFCVLYFLYRFFAIRSPFTLRDFFRKIGVCAASVALSFGLSAWLMVPTLIDLMQGKMGNASYTPKSYFPFYLHEILRKLLPAQYDTIQYAGTPSIFCGTLVLLLVVIYFINRRITRREKLFSLGMLVLFIVSFMIIPIDTIWHVFQAPNWFPYRYSFLFSFFLIYLAFRTVTVLEEPVAAFFTTRKKGIKAGAMAVAVLLCGLSVIEMYGNGAAMIEGLDQEFGYRSESEYLSFYDQLRPLVDYAEQQGDDFYRIEKDFEYTKNDALTMGYHGITHYSSAYNRHINQTTAKLGFAQTYFWNSYFGSTPVTDSLFGVRYVMSKGKLPEFYRPVMQNGSVTLYENPYYLPIGIASSVDLGKYEITGYDYFATQNKLLSAIYGEDVSVFESVPFERTAKTEELTYRFMVSSDAPCYISLAGNSLGSATVYVNGMRFASYFTGETKHCLYLGSFVPGQEVTVTFRLTGQVGLLSDDIYLLDVDRYAAVMTELQQRSLQVTDYQNATINGNIDMTENGYIFFSIPYDEGFTVWVDGQQVSYTSCMDTFLLLPLSAGRHTIRTAYTASGFSFGIILTGVSLLTLLGYLIFWLFRHRKKE